MTQLTVDITMSLDGFVAGPNQTLDEPLGAGGEQLHDWAFATAAFQSSHGRDGDRQNPTPHLTLPRVHTESKCGTLFT